MAQPVFDSSIKKLYGEQVALSTTASHLLYRPLYHEAELHCASEFRLGLAPKLVDAVLYNASTYTSYLTQATDRDDTTHVPLDAMAATHYLYLGVTNPTRGFYFNVVTNVNDNAATLDMEYLYDVAGEYSSGREPYLKLTGTVSAALTVGETVTGQTSGATATHVYDDGSTYIIVKDISGVFVVGEDVDGAAQTCDDLTAIAQETKGTGYFTDVASDSDGTDVGPGDTLKQAGLYAFTLPSVVKGQLASVSGEVAYWYRFAPSATLSATVDLVDIIPACDTVNYAYRAGGVIHQIALNLDKNGAFEFDMDAGTDTLNLNWIQH